jgi:multiple sugar transport system substrate-binding protein
LPDVGKVKSRRGIIFRPAAQANEVYSVYLEIKLMRKITVPILMTLVMLNLFAACGQSDDRSVSFMISGEPAELSAYEELVELFNEKSPDFEVVLIYVASGKEFREKLGTMFTGNVPPDVFLYNYRRLGDYAEANAVFPLGSNLDASPVLDRNDFYSVTLDAFTYKGQLQCIPQNLSSPVIYYNEALFVEAGVDFPEPGWTLDDFLTTAKALTRDRDGDGKLDQWGFGSEIETIRLAPFIWSNGGEILNTAQDPYELQLGSNETRDAIRWFVDLQMQQQVAPDLVSETAQSSEDRFLNGTIAMLMNSRVGVPTLRTITAFSWDVAPLPLGDRPASVLHSDGFCMSAKAARDEEHAARAWQFIEFAVSEEGQTILAGTGRTVPSMVRVAESDAFLMSFPPTNNHVYLEAAEYIRALPMLPGWNTFEELLSKELQRAYYGDVDVAMFLERADGLVDSVFNK